MSVLTTIFNQYFGIIILIIGVFVAINLITSLFKKSGEVAFTGGKYIFLGFFSFIWKILSNIFKVFEILFLLLALILAWIFKRKKKVYKPQDISIYTKGTGRP